MAALLLGASAPALAQDKAPAPAKPAKTNAEAQKDAAEAAYANASCATPPSSGGGTAPSSCSAKGYGTVRSGALAYQLQDRGMALNGVVLLSSIMNYGTRQLGLDQVYLNYLPSYATSA